MCWRCQRFGHVDINVEVAEHIFKAAEISIPRSKVNGEWKRAIFWNDEYDKPIKERKKVRRKIKKSISLYDFYEFKRTKVMGTKVIKVAKRRSWVSFLFKVVKKTKLGLGMESG